MVAAFDHCLFGKGGAAPSIDTAMHGLVEAPHVDHLHPDSGIAFATAADGEALTRACFGDRVAWVPWRRPGFQLGLDMAAVQRDNPQAIGAVLGGHGITAWGETSEACEANSLEIIRTAERYIAEHGRPGAVRAGDPGVRGAARRRATRARRGARSPSSAASRPRTGRRSATTPTATSCSTSSPARRTRASPRSAPRAPTTSCARRSGRWSSTCRRPRRSRRPSPGCASCTRRIAPTTPPTTSATRRRTARAMRGADPAIVLVPGRRHVQLRREQADRAGRGRVLRQRDQRDARRRGALHATRRSRRRRSSGSSTGRSRRPSCSGCRSRSRSPRGSRSSPAAAPGSAGRSQTGSRPRAPASSSPTSTPDAAEAAAAEIGDADVALGVRCDVTDEAQVAAAFATAVLAFGGVDIVVNNAGLSISKPLLDTTVDDWDLQHDVMARGSFLVSREAARVMSDQAHGRRHRLHRQQERVVRRAEQRRLRRGEGRPGPPGPAARRRARASSASASTASTPTASSGARASSPRAGARTARGPTASPEEKLGEFYAQRTLLKREVLPEHVAAAVFALVGRRPRADHRAAHPGRRRRRGGVPAVTRRASSRARRPRRVERPGHRRPGRAGRAGSRGPPVPERAGPADDGLHWDVLALYRRDPRGPSPGAASGAGDRVSIGIDTWGVDYGSLDDGGALLGNPFHYRDARNAPASSASTRASPRAELYATERPPVPAVQHALPARGRAGRRRVRDRARPCC